ncbi:MAG: 3-deoxy-7-phosphoheptulonate synthase [Polyangiaceae bacterium]
MIIILTPDVSESGPEVAEVLALVARFPTVTPKVHGYRGSEHGVVEIHLIGVDKDVPEAPFRELSSVVQVVRVSEKYRLIGRHSAKLDAIGFDYRGLRFGQDTLHLFPGLCAVDTPENVDLTFAAIAKAGIKTARAGAYKPRTSPYDFQGLGAACLPWVFELAGKNGIEIVAMEILREKNIDEIAGALAKAGNPCGVFLQIGTRNAQNFELLRYAGQQREFPVLYKRGMGITIEESLNACEYIASEGNRNILFCLRGVKSHLGDPHRNLVDFAHVPVVKRLTRLGVCVDPSHSTGRRTAAPDGLTDIHHATAQGIIAGANMVLVDFHPSPATAMCDGPQALTLDELPAFVRDCQVVRDCYLSRVQPSP